MNSSVKKPLFWLLVLCLALLVLINSQVSEAAVDAGSSIRMTCRGFDLRYDFIPNRNNAPAPRQEVFTFRAIDAAGTGFYTYVSQPLYFPINGRHVRGRLQRPWDTRPRMNPIVFEIISEPGNLLPRQVIFTARYFCPGLPTYRPTRTPTPTIATTEPPAPTVTPTVPANPPDLTIAIEPLEGLFVGQDRILNIDITNIGTGNTNDFPVLNAVFPPTITRVLTDLTPGWACDNTPQGAICRINENSHPIEPGLTERLRIPIHVNSPGTGTISVTVTTINDTNVANNSATTAITVDPAPTATETPSETPTETPTETPSETPTQTSTPTFTPSPSRTISPTQTRTNTLVPTNTWTPTIPTSTRTRTNTPVPPSPTRTLTPILPPTATNTATPIPQPDVTITKTHAGTFFVGLAGSYTFTVTNIGPGPTSGPITVVDTLPSSLFFLRVNGAGWACGAEIHTVTCVSNVVLAPGASTTFSLDVSVFEVGTFVNTVTVSVVNDTSPANNTASDTTVVNLPMTATDLPVPRALHEKGYTTEDENE